MSIKLIATDMDGTFLRDDHTYNHSLFAKVFRQLERHNIYFVAASGSSFHGCNENLKTTPPRWDLFRKTDQLSI